MLVVVLGVLGAVAIGVGALALYLWYLTPNPEDMR